MGGLGRVELIDESSILRDSLLIVAAIVQVSKSLNWCLYGQSGRVVVVAFVPYSSRFFRDLETENQFTFAG